LWIQLKPRDIDDASEKEKILAGELYDAGVPQLQAELAAAQKWLARYHRRAQPARLMDRI
jgi:maltose O-acetyltransferase